MDYKKVLESQIEILERLSDENKNSISKAEHKIDSAVRIAEQIRLLCEDARRL